MADQQTPPAPNLCPSAHEQGSLGRSDNRWESVHSVEVLTDRVEVENLIIGGDEYSQVISEMKGKSLELSNKLAEVSELLARVDERVDTLHDNDPDSKLIEASLAQISLLKGLLDEAKTRLSEVSIEHGDWKESVTRQSKVVESIGSQLADVVGEIGRLISDMQEFTGLKDEIEQLDIDLEQIMSAINANEQEITMKHVELTETKNQLAQNQIVLLKAEADFNHHTQSNIRLENENKNRKQSLVRHAEGWQNSSNSLLALFQSFDIDTITPDEDQSWWMALYQEFVT